MENLRKNKEFLLYPEGPKIERRPAEGFSGSPGLPSVSSLGSLDLLEGPTMENSRKNMHSLFHPDGPLVLLVFLLSLPWAPYTSLKGQQWNARGKI